MSGAMTMDNERWEDFLERLSEKMNEPDYECDATTDKRAAREVLVRMGLTSDEIAETFDYLESRGGFCDCEIFLNVDMPPSWFEEDDED